MEDGQLTSQQKDGRQDNGEKKQLARHAAPERFTLLADPCMNGIGGGHKLFVVIESGFIDDPPPGTADMNEESAALGCALVTMCSSFRMNP